MISFPFVFKKNIFHRGYISDIYKINTSQGEVLKKCFGFKKQNKVLDMTIEEIFKEEIGGIRLLSLVEEDKIKTPKIVEINFKNLCYTQRYFRLMSFNNYFIFRSFFLGKRREVFDLFYRLGRYLGKFHKKSGRLHGDLNRRNILFGRHFIFICDPTFIKENSYGKFTFDLFKVISNIYSYNLFARLFIRNKGTIIKFFLKGYVEGRNVILDKNGFKQDLIEYLERKEVLLSKKMAHRLKSFFIAKLNRRLAMRFKNNKLKWFNEI